MPRASLKMKSEAEPAAEPVRYQLRDVSDLRAQRERLVLAVANAKGDVAAAEARFDEHVRALATGERSASRSAASSDAVLQEEISHFRMNLLAKSRALELIDEELRKYDDPARVRAAKAQREEFLRLYEERLQTIDALEAAFRDGVAPALARLDEIKAEMAAALGGNGIPAMKIDEDRAMRFSQRLLKYLAGYLSEAELRSSGIADKRPWVDQERQLRGDPRKLVENVS